MFTLQLSIEFINCVLIGGAFSCTAPCWARLHRHDRSVLTYLKDDIPGVVAGVARRLARAPSAPPAFKARRRVRFGERPERRDLR